MYSVIWGQCSLSIQAKLKQNTDFKQKNKDKDCVLLLNEIKSAIYRYNSTSDIFYSISEAQSNLEYAKQQKESDEEFYDNFRSHVEAFEHLGGSIGNDEGLTASLKDPTDVNHLGDMPTGVVVTVTELLKWIQSSDEYEKEIKEKARERYLAMLFLKKVSREKYGTLWTSLKNYYSRGTKQYPTTLSDVYGMICAQTPEHRDNRRGREDKEKNNDPQPQGFSFLQQGIVVAGSDGKTFPGITCFRCQKKGHYASHCPKGDGAGFNALQVYDDSNTGKPKVDFMFAQIHYVFTQAHAKDIPDMWVLLDSQSTTSIFCNSRSTLR